MRFTGASASCYHTSGPRDSLITFTMMLCAMEPCATIRPSLSTSSRRATGARETCNLRAICCVKAITMRTPVYWKLAADVSLERVNSVRTTSTWFCNHLDGFATDVDATSGHIRANWFSRVNTSSQGSYGRRQARSISVRRWQWQCTWECYSPEPVNGLRVCNALWHFISTIYIELHDVHEVKRG